MFGVVLALSALMIQFALACDLIRSGLELEIAGDGFHRTMYVRANVSGNTRLINCQIVYLLQIPHGAYVDVDRLNESLHGHCFIAKHFNVEEPAGSSTLPQLQPLYLHSGKLLSRAFLVQDSFSFPVHLRYHPPSDGDDTRDERTPSIVFDSPRLYMRCENNESILADTSCRNRVERIPCACSTTAPRCSYIHLTTLPFTTEVTVTVAGKTHLTMIMVSTPLAVCISFLAIITAVAMSGNKTKAEYTG